MGKKRHRSPSYPAIGLDAAIRLAEKIYPHAKHAMGADFIAQEWQYKNGATASPYLAALKQYGLLGEESGGTDRMFRFSELALDILVAPDGETPQRADAIKAAATKPRLHAELWEKWGRSLPPDAEIRRHLERERNFNPKYVEKVIGNYKTTIAFANLSNLDTMEDESPGDDSSNGREDDPSPPETSCQNDPKPRQRERRQMATGTKEDVYTLATGDVVLQWPEHITAEEADDLDDWLEIMKRKLKRSVVIADDLAD